MLNKYRRTLDAFLEQQQQIPLVNKFNYEGEPASWQDWGWTIKRNDGTSMNVFFIDPYKLKSKPRLIPSRTYSEDQILPSPWRQLAMSYTLHVENKNVSDAYLRRVNITARHIFSNLPVELTSFDQATLDAFFEQWSKKSVSGYFPHFFKWCRGLGIIRKTLKIPAFKSRMERTFEASLQSIKSKMPDTRALMALASISHDLIVNPTEPLIAKYRRNLRYEYVACMATLATASPNRVSAEQTVLAKQSLKSDTTRRRKDNTWVEKTVYFLDWQGSKGSKDNRNHILSAMQHPVDKVLKFLKAACEPARVLCRFYESPNKPLESLLGDCTVQTDRLKNIDTNKPVNMFQLGYILGFYDDRDQQIRLYESKDNLSSQCQKKIYKPVWQLKENDILRLSRTLQPTLMGATSDKLFPCKAITVGEFQTAWIAYIKTKVATFPWRVEKKNKIHLSHALFCFTGEQLSSSPSNYVMGASFFAIEPVNLGYLFHAFINPRTDDRGFLGIFEAFGFSKDIRINPHQFRHWLNHIAQASELSDEVIAIWSGRKDINQNAVYDHTPDSDRVAQIGNTRNRLDQKTDEDLVQKIRIITAEEYHQSTGKAANITATGICTQELSVSPCVYLNDFMSHCALCSSSCHVNRDKKAIEILKKDYEIQQVRLDEISANENFHVNTRQQDWFLMHHRNTSLLKQLIELMESKDIILGSPIRYVGSDGVFRITDLSRKHVDEVKVALPNSKEKMKKLIDKTSASNNAPTENKALSDLLAEFGISEAG